MLDLEHASFVVLYIHSFTYLSDSMHEEATSGGAYGHGWMTQ